MPQSFKKLAREYFANRYKDGQESSAAANGPLEESLVSLERDEDLSERVSEMLPAAESPPVEMDEGAAPSIPSSQEALPEETPEPDVSSSVPQVDIEDPSLPETAVDAQEIDHQEVPRDDIQIEVPEAEIRESAVANAPPPERIESGTAEAVEPPVIERGTQAAVEGQSPPVEQPVEVSEPRVSRRKGPSIPSPDRGIVSEGMQEFEEPDVRLESSARIDAKFAPGIQSTTILPKDADFDVEAMLDDVAKREVVIPDEASPVIGNAPELDPLPDVNAVITNSADAHMFRYGRTIMNWERQ